MTSFLGQNTSYTFLSSSTFPYSSKPKPKPWRVHFITYAQIPARDRIIDFGKYKGRMLGTLPSTYLKWVSNNLRARDFEEWANLADQVLQDPVYNDRVEWEFAEKLLNGDTMSAKVKSQGAVSELLEISQRFGWDNEDKLGWSKVDFLLLGTSKGGRIPRAKEKKEGKVVPLKKAGDGGGTSRGEKRGERREKLKMKRRMQSLNGGSFDNNVVESEGKKSDQNEVVYNPFPGREALLRKALNRRSSF